MEQKEYPANLNGFDTNAELQQVTEIVNASIEKSGCNVNTIYIKKLPLPIIQIDLHYTTRSGEESTKIRLYSNYTIEVPYVSDARIKSEMFDMLVDLRYHLINGDFDFAFNKEVA